MRQTIALDSMGGDFGPEVFVPGAAIALKRRPDLSFIFFGDEKRIVPLIAAFPDLKKASVIVHTDKAISGKDKPSVAIRSSRDSSMRLAIESVRDGKAQGIVSAGNTGALMVLSKMILKSLSGVDRPAIASLMPTLKGRVLMLDLGANLECGSEVLVQFALLGAVYARVVMGIEEPTVGLLNVGTEDMKGHEEVRAAASILSQVRFPGRYHGFVEGNDIMKGTVDVVVTDGFSGNIALKSIEGVGKFMASLLRESFKSSLFARLGYVFSASAMKRLKHRLNPSQYNGGMFLGLAGICVKSHGGSDIEGTSNAILVAADLIGNGFNERVAQEMDRLLRQECLHIPQVTCE